MTGVRITGVRLFDPPGDHLLGANVERPVAGAASDIHAFSLVGWAVGRSQPVEAVEVLDRGRLAAELHPNRPRQDIAEAFAGSDADVAGPGFGASISALSFAETFEVVVRLRMADGTRLPLAVLQGERGRLPVGDAGRLQPLLVNTIGRSGSTLLTRLLSAHPELVAFHPLAHDARVATYWVAVMQDLLQPYAYEEQIAPANVETAHWWLGQATHGDEALQTDVSFKAWVREIHVPAVVSFCQARIEAFYTALTRTDGARYFVEKVQPFQVHPDLLAEIYPDAREIILVRDFRDVLCSVRAFNRKRGFAAFGADQVEDELEYVRRVLGPSARDLAERWRRRHESALLIRYEDLVRSPVDTAARIASYAGVSADSALLSKIVEEAQTDPASEEHRTVPDPVATIGRWRHDLDDELKAACAHELDESLDAFGYEQSDVARGLGGA